MPCAIVLSPFLALFFPSPSLLQIADAKKVCQQTLHYPKGCYPDPFHRLLLIFFPSIQTFLPFFFLVFGPQFLNDFYDGYVLPKLAFYKKKINKNSKNKSQYPKIKESKTVKPKMFGWEWTWNTNCQTVAHCKFDSHAPSFTLTLKITLFSVHIPCWASKSTMWKRCPMW